MYFRSIIFIADNKFLFNDTGTNCEQKYSECMNHPCLNNGTCLDNNGFTCQCLEGFSGKNNKKRKKLSNGIRN